MNKSQKIFCAVCVFIAIVSLLFVWSRCLQAGDYQARTYFDKKYLPALLGQISSARQSIDVEMYNINNYPKTIKALEQASKRGVCVRILADNQGANDPKNENGTGLPEKELEDAGICVRWENSSRTMHRKLCIIDNRVICLGSHNWTRNGFENNAEVSIILEDSVKASELGMQFEADWTVAREVYETKEK